MTTETGLAQKSCTPCRGGVPRFTAAEAEAHRVAVPLWTLSEDATWIARDFKFTDFLAALAFVQAVGAVAESEGHHPDIRFGWGYATVALQTHKIGGLHDNDFILAAKIDELPGPS